MSVTGLLFLIAAALYAGFQITIRLLVYPQLARVPAAAFVAYEAAHQRLVSRVVGPLFAALVLTVAALVIDRPRRRHAGSACSRRCWSARSWSSPQRARSPCTRSQHGFDPAAHRRLLAVDSARVLVSVACVAIAAYLVNA